MADKSTHQRVMVFQTAQEIREISESPAQSGINKKLGDLERHIMALNYLGKCPQGRQTSQDCKNCQAQGKPCATRLRSDLGRGVLFVQAGRKGAFTWRDWQIDFWDCLDAISEIPCRDISECLCERCLLVKLYSAAEMPKWMLGAARAVARRFWKEVRDRGLWDTSLQIMSALERR